MTSEENPGERAGEAPRSVVRPVSIAGRWFSARLIARGSDKDLGFAAGPPWERRDGPAQIRTKSSSTIRHRKPPPTLAFTITHRRRCIRGPQPNSAKLGAPRPTRSKSAISSTVKSYNRPVQTWLIERAKSLTQSPFPHPSREAASKRLP